MKTDSKLGEYRRSLNLSQEQMAEALGISQSAIAKIEAGKTFGKGLFVYLKFLVDNGIDVNGFFK